MSELCIVKGVDRKGKGEDDDGHRIFLWIFNRNCVLYGSSSTMYFLISRFRFVVLGTRTEIGG